MPFFFKKQKKIIQIIQDYLSKIDECQLHFLECIECLVGEVHPAGYEELVNRVHKAESQADDLRRSIEFELYNKALVPESRGDILGILEALDKIPNYFEAICFQIYLQRLVVPQPLRQDVLKLVNKNIEAYTELKKAVNGLFYSRDVYDIVLQVDVIESSADKIERDLIKRIFLLNIDKAEKILLKQVVLTIGDISDRAQTVADKVRIAFIKRRI